VKHANRLHSLSHFARQCGCGGLIVDYCREQMRIKFNDAISLGCSHEGVATYRSNVVSFYRRVGSRKNLGWTVVRWACVGGAELDTALAMSGAVGGGGLGIVSKRSVIGSAGVAAVHEIYSKAKAS
jgi:hypothetical protein